MRYVAILFILALVGCSGSNTDAKMQSHYEKKKEYFSALVSGTDCHFDKDKILFRSEVTKENSACLKLMAEVEANGVDIDPFSGRVVVYPFWLNFSSKQKGYVYSAEELTPLYPSLDEHPEDLHPYERGYKKIADKWYIYYEYVN